MVCSQVPFLPVSTRPLLPPSTTSCLQTPDKTILYSVATTLVNCTNSYDVKEVIPELVQLAKFSKQHVPEEHPKVAMRTAGRGGGCPPPDHQRGGTGWCVCVRACEDLAEDADKVQVCWL